MDEIILLIVVALHSKKICGTESGKNPGRLCSYKEFVSVLGMCDYMVTSRYSFYPANEYRCH